MRLNWRLTWGDSSTSWLTWVTGSDTKDWIRGIFVRLANRGMSARRGMFGRGPIEPDRGTGTSGGLVLKPQ